MWWGILWRVGLFSIEGSVGKRQNLLQSTHFRAGLRLGKVMPSSEVCRWEGAELRPKSVCHWIPLRAKLCSTVCP